MIAIKFTLAQAQAIRHRIECADVLVEVFNDSDHLMHMAEAVEARARDFSTELTAFNLVTVDPDSELDMAILIEAIEGSTWVAVHDNADVSHQALAAARTALNGAAAAIQTAFGLPDDSISVPEA